MGEPKIFRYVWPTKNFQVFKHKEGKLKEIKSLGDRILFLGSHPSISLDAKDYPGFKGNRIYFTSHSSDSPPKMGSGKHVVYDGDDCGVFNMEDGRIESFPHCMSHLFVNWPAHVWFTPKERRVSMASSSSSQIFELQNQCKPPPPLPHLMLTSIHSHQTTESRYFVHLLNNTIERLAIPLLSHESNILGSVHGSLIVIDPQTIVQLLDPIKSTVVCFPPLTTMSEFIVPRNEAKGEYKINEAADEYVVENEHGRCTWGTKKLKDLFIQKLILLADGTTAVANVKALDRLAFARAGADAWEVADTRVRCTDMLCYKGQVYSVDEDGVVARCDAGPPPTVTPITYGAITSGLIEYPYCIWYLVESSGDLLLVRRCMGEEKMYPYEKPTKNFQVFKLDRLDKEGKLMELMCLGDRILFLGSHPSISLDAKDYPGFKGNHIYFTSHWFEAIMKKQRPGGVVSTCDKLYVGDDCGVFNLDDGSIESFPHRSRYIWPPHVWFTPTRS